MKFSLRFAIITFLTLSLFLSPSVGESANIDELRSKIDEQQKQLEEINRVIAHYESQIETVGKQADNLKNKIQSLELERKKLLASIKSTQGKIRATNLIIEKLDIEIGDKEERIEKGRQVIGQSFRKIASRESQSLLELMLSYEDLGRFWTEVDSLNRFQGEIKNAVDDLRDAKRSLEGSKSEQEERKSELVMFTKELASKTEIVESNKEETNSILIATKNEEAAYKRLLEEKRKQHEELEREIADLESQLRIAVDPASIPKAGSGVLKWPFAPDYIEKCKQSERSLKNIFCITQYYGKTAFATKNPQAYSGKGHNGIDFRAPTGTAVRAVLDGIVVETGNTDEVRGCLSYGKWIVIRHNNGLSTLYAHLSSISVGADQTVATGETIGYSGSTGYSTGPHLHLTVFATQGMKIMALENSVRCRNVRIPVADYKAYLNPLSYL